MNRVEFATANKENIERMKKAANTYDPRTAMVDADDSDDDSYFQDDDVGGDVDDAMHRNEAAATPATAATAGIYPVKPAAMDRFSAFVDDQAA